VINDANTSRCHETLETFQDVCKSWGVPLADDKTVEPVEVLTFLGVELDTIKMEMRLPQDKQIVSLEVHTLSSITVIPL
jgi:hypothetical protein